MLRKSCINQRVHEWEQNLRILFEIHGLTEGVNALTKKLQSNFKMILPLCSCLPEWR